MIVPTICIGENTYQCNQRDAEIQDSFEKVFVHNKIVRNTNNELRKTQEVIRVTKYDLLTAIYEKPPYPSFSVFRPLFE